MVATVAIAEELLTESQAAARVPGRRSEVVKWLRGLGIARKGPTGIRLYRLSEVLAYIPLEDEPMSAPEKVTQKTTLRRSTAI
jgi:hypothetical protein